MRKEDFMKYLSRNQAENWLTKHVNTRRQKYNFNNKFMNMLKKTYRLVPDKDTLFGRKYSLLELKEYARDVRVG